MTSTELSTYFPILLTTVEVNTLDENLSRVHACHVQQRATLVNTR
jgi:hypothetical protein